MRVALGFDRLGAAEHGLEPPPDLNDAKFRDDFWKQGATMWDAVHGVGLRSVFMTCCAAAPPSRAVAVRGRRARSPFGPQAAEPRPPPPGAAGQPPGGPQRPAPQFGPLPALTLTRSGRRRALAADCSLGEQVRDSCF